MRSIALILTAIGVCAGAFGAHGLKNSVTPERLEVFKTASSYEIAMSIVLLILATQGQGDGWGAYILLFGIVVFSGSLYLLVLLDLPILGAVTPLGGTALIFGLLMAAASWKE
jgi:uncharacterized membrane protein YgdD (TMEM256/DUF423 family)